eukprot:GGOE01060994.1.p2 GENE.GGOE01060994.1~~GGOE01060994.1.p2  ORF type:complete len:182 (+),score=21.92 GGOE01060994.1:102-647(+)
MQLFHTVRFMDLCPGDHLYCWRIAGSYAHHGILVKKGADPATSYVVEFGPPRGNGASKEWSPGLARIQKVTLEDFACGCAIRRVQYKASATEQWIKRRGTATSQWPDAPEVVVQRALLAVNGLYEWGPYDVLTNNCEHFASWCATGSCQSHQVPQVLAAAHAQTVPSNEASSELLAVGPSC